MGVDEEGAMTDRTTIERILNDAYAARCRGDVDAICDMFCQDAHYEMSGSRDASPVAAHVKGSPGFQQMLDQQIKIFEMSDPEILSMVIDGDKAAVRWRAKVRSTVTGHTVTTELFDFIEFKDGKIASFIEMCDTAMAARLMGPVPTLMPA
jgi:ketosteroid isomerase-like protein